LTIRAGVVHGTGGYCLGARAGSGTLVAAVGALVSYIVVRRLGEWVALAND